MEQVKNILSFIVLMGLCFGAGVIGVRSCAPEQLPLPKSDTVVRYDTVKLPVPKIVYITDVRTDTVELPALLQKDTVKVPVLVPITQSEYKTDEYHAYVSGFRAKLDSISVFNRVTTINNSVPYAVAKRWGLGVQVGIGTSTKLELTPYIGIGITYNIFSW